MKYIIDEIHFLLIFISNFITVPCLEVVFSTICSYNKSDKKAQ